MIYQWRNDKETFRLNIIYIPTTDKPPEWTFFTTKQIKEQMEALRAPPRNNRWKLQWKRAFLLSATMLLSGERHHRQLIQRKTAKGVRNITIAIRPSTEYVEETCYLEMIKKLSKGIKRNKKEQMRYEELTKLIRKTLKPIKNRLKFPDSDPVIYSYTIPDAVIAKVSKKCQDFLKQVKSQGVLLTDHIFDNLRENIMADFPNEASVIIDAIEKTKNREHLSAISLNSKDGQLVVSIVNQQGDLLSMEGWKLIRLIEEHDTILTLGNIDRQGSWQALPLLELNNRKSGELIGQYTAEDSTIQVVCRQEFDKGKGKVSKSEPDRASFMLDQDYLVSLYVAIVQLKNDKQRFEHFKEEAETRKAINMDDLFDPGLRNTLRTGGNK